MGYILVGAIWCWWLEYYTTGMGMNVLGRKWVWRERFFHTLLWPFSLATFVYEFVKQIL